MPPWKRCDLGIDKLKQLPCQTAMLPKTNPEDLFRFAVQNDRLGIRTRVNGELRQESNTRELIFDVFDQVAHLLEVMTLEPGDVVFSGAPGGVGALMKPPVFLRDGNRVQCEIDELGKIECVCKAE